MTVRSARLAGFAAALVALAIDRGAKYLVTGPLGLNVEGQTYYLLPFFSLTRANSYGVSFSMLPATTDTMRWLLVAALSAIVLVVLVWLLRERRAIDTVPLGLVLGGALSNILDRVTLGYVIDYADFHLGAWRPFLISNFADWAISIGVVIILARALFMREKPPTPHGGTENDHPADRSAERP
jgi:signal peptidase II